MYNVVHCFTAAYTAYQNFNTGNFDIYLCQKSIYTGDQVKQKQRLQM